MAEIHGEAWTEIAKDGIISLLNDLVIDMVADDPKPSYVYDRHDTAKLLLNGITIELDGVEPDPAFTDYNMYYLMSFSIRVHTDYIGGGRDANKNRRLLNSIWNKLKANVKNISAGYRLEAITEMNPVEEYYFTIGGSMLFDVAVTITHTQE